MKLLFVLLFFFFYYNYITTPLLKYDIWKTKKCQKCKQLWFSSITWEFASLGRWEYDYVPAWFY